MKSKFLVFRIYLVLSFLNLVFAPLSGAQTPSPSATAGAQQLRDAVQQKVAQELANLKQAVARKAYVGNISAKSDVSITITNLKNQSRTALVSADTTIKLLAGKDGTPADLKVGNFVIAMGDVDSNGVLTAKRLLVINAPAADRREVVFGTVTKALTSSLTVENKNKETWTVRLSSSTKYTGNTKATDIKVGSKIVAAGSVTADTTLSAGFAHLFPAQ